MFAVRIYYAKYQRAHLRRLYLSVAKVHRLYTSTISALVYNTDEISQLTLAKNQLTAVLTAASAVKFGRLFVKYREPERFQEIIAKVVAGAKKELAKVTEAERIMLLLKKELTSGLWRCVFLPCASFISPVCFCPCFRPGCGHDLRHCAVSHESRRSDGS